MEMHRSNSDKLVIVPYQLLILLCVCFCSLIIISVPLTLEHLAWAVLCMC